MGLEKVGLQGIFDLKDFNRKLSGYLDGIEKAEKTTDSAAPPIQKGLTGIGTAAAGAAGVAGAALVAIGAGLTKLAIDAAPLEQVGSAFRGLGGDIQALREGSLGMVTDADLMKQYNSAAQLVSKTFADQLPEAMEYLSKVAGSTGESMEYMMDSLVRGVGRMSGPILDNLKIQVAQAEITERATAMYGKQAEELSKLEMQEATMALTMEKLAAKTASIPDVTGSAAHGMATLSTTVKNLKDDMGVELLPVLEELYPLLIDFVEEVGPGLVEFAQSMSGAMVGATGFVQGLLDAVKDATGYRDKLAGLREEAIATTDTYEGMVAAFLQSSDKFANAWAQYQKGGEEAQRVIELLVAMGQIPAEAAYQTEAAAVKTSEAVVEIGDAAAEAKVAVDQFAYGAGAAWAQYGAAVRKAWGEALDPITLEKGFDGLIDVALEHQGKMVAITGEGADKEKAVQQQKYMDQLKQQYNYILESMKAAMYKMSTENTEAGKAAKAALGILTATNTAKLADEYGYVVDSLKLKEQLLAGEITTAQGMVDAYQAVAAARDGALAEAQAQLDKLASTVAGSGPQMAQAAESATKPIDDVFDDAIKSVASGLESMRDLLHEIAGDEFIQGGSFEEHVDNLLWAMEVVVGKTLVKVRDLGLQYGDLLEESTETSEQINKALSVLENLGNIQQFGGGYDYLVGGQLEDRVDNFVWALGIVADHVILQMQNLRKNFGIDVLKETAKTSEEIDKTLALLGSLADIQQFGDDYIGLRGGDLEAHVDNYVWALGVVAARIIVQMQNLRAVFGGDALTEASETSAVINDTLAVVGSLGDLGQLGTDYGYFQVGALESATDNYAWALGVVASRMITKMQQLRRVFGIDVLTDAAETAKVISTALSPLSAIPDMMALQDYELLPDQLLDDVLSNLDYLFDGMIDIANAAKDKIDDRTKEVVDIMGATFGALGSAIDVLLTLGGLEEKEKYESLFDATGQSELWEAIKTDLQTLLTDIAGWNLLVDVDAIKAVNAKLTEARGVVDNMLGIVSDITAMREQGGADVYAFRAILTQFSDVVNALGWGGAGVFAPPDAPGVINPPDLSPVGAGMGAGASNTTITIRGEFVGPSGDFVTFSEEVMLARDTDINLGQIGSPNYAY